MAESAAPEPVAAPARADADALGERMAKFPLLFAKPVFFGDVSSREEAANVKNGTVTLVDLDNGFLAVTCAHVLAAYREMKNEMPRALFQIGSTVIDTEHQIIAENRDLDLVTIEISDDQAKEINSDGEIGSCFFKPAGWPSSPLAVGEFVALGGFPGAWRRFNRAAEVEFGTFSSGATGVTSVHPDRFACQFEREYWVRRFGDADLINLRELGGMSGGPAFIKRALHWDLVGFIYEFNATFDIMFLRHSNVLNPDGSLAAP